LIGLKRFYAARAENADGNYIPSRDQVQANTKGSYEFVVEHMGKAWAYEMRELI